MNRISSKLDRNLLTHARIQRVNWTMNYTEMLVLESIQSMFSGKRPSSKGHVTSYVSKDIRVWEIDSHLHDVDDQGQHVAHEEHEDDDHEHGGEADLALLESGQLGAFGVGTANLQGDESKRCRQPKLPMFPVDFMANRVASQVLMGHNSLVPTGQCYQGANKQGLPPRLYLYRVRGLFLRLSVCGLREARGLCKLTSLTYY